MAFRVVVVSKSAKLDLKINHLIVRDPEITRIHISEIAVLILESTAISITIALLSELIKQKVKIIFCDEQRNPISELIPCYGSHDCSAKLFMQIRWENNIKQRVWTEIVRQKISKQKQVLKFYNLYEYIKLEQYEQDIQLNDITNREGHAAKVYFNAPFGRGFSREKDCYINAGLNYGYNILLSAFNREIVASGYITQLGIFHKNTFNPFNLTCDLMESFRPIVDATVKSMGLQCFEKKEKMHIVNILNKEVYIGDTKQYLLNAIKIYIKSVFNILNRESTLPIKAYSIEL